MPNPISRAGNTSHGPYEGLEVENVTGTSISYDKQGEVRDQGISFNTRVATTTGSDLCPIDESRYTMTISMLPDDVLLDIFVACRMDGDFDWFNAWGRNGLVHVCRRWRQLIFGSSRRLGLRLPCTHGTPVRKNLGSWPPFPITICYCYGLTPDDEDSVLAVLEHPDRVCQVYLILTGPRLEEIATVMQQPFPALTHLTLERECEGPPALPSGFLRGSAPCLRHLHLKGIAIPELPMLLSSTRDLVDLDLRYIPKEGYILPEAMVACLSALPRLQSLSIHFFSPTSRPDRIHPPPLARIMLSSLTSFEFWGASTYLEELISRIDSPRLNQIHIKYSQSPLAFQIGQLFLFIDRSEDPELALIKYADVAASDPRLTLEMYPCPGMHPARGRITVCIPCPVFERRISYVVQVFNQPSALLSRIVHLKLSPSQSRANEDPHNNEWLLFLSRLSAIRTLHVFGRFTECLALALENATAGEMATEVLPVLDLIYFSRRPKSCIEKFLEARQISGHPVTLIRKRADLNKLKSCICEYEEASSHEC